MQHKITFQNIYIFSLVAEYSVWGDPEYLQTTTMDDKQSKNASNWNKQNDPWQINILFRF